MAWILVPCLVSLRTEFNTLAPDRDRTSDGSIGDQAHASSSSDHNPDETGATPYEDADSRDEVHAIDVDADLRKPGWTMQRAVDRIVTRHRSGLDDRLQNVIYNRRVWSRSWGWAERRYTGSNPHDKHAHFSARYTAGQESDTRPWGLLDQEDDGVSVQDVRDYFASAAKGVRGGGNSTNIQDRKDLAAVLRFALGFNWSEQEAPDFGAKLPPARFDQLAAAIAGAGDVDESALAAALAPVLGLQRDAVAAGLRQVLREGVDR